MRKVAVLVAAFLLAGVFAMPAQAGQASCSESPNDVPLNSNYTFSVNGGPSNGLVYVWVTYNGGWRDGVGLRLDSSGNGSVGLSTFSYASTLGYAKATVVRNDGQKNKIASCGFEVVT